MATPFFVPFRLHIDFKLKERTMSKTDLQETITLFQASMHVFIPLKHIKKEWKANFANNCQRIAPEPIIRNTEAELWYWELIGKEQEFSFHSCITKEGDRKKEIISRKITLHLYLVKFVSSQLNPKGRYHLVLGTGIDRKFSDDTVCDEKDLIYLKKAFYEQGNKGLQSPTAGIPSFNDWLSSVVEDISGRKPNGHFNRHYIVNIKATKGDFDKEYYEDEPKRYEKVINGADRLAYALLYGNNNIEVVPEETINEAFKNTFTNNISQKMFAGNKTIVFFKTHSDIKCCFEEGNREKPFDYNFGTALNVFDICFVMEAKFKLKSIQKMMQGHHPFRTKRALASISDYMNVNPFHLAEIKKRTDYLYEALGVNSLFLTVKEQGVLLSESSTAVLSFKLNTKVKWLTVLTVLLAALQLVVSILCCNNSNNSSSMCDCFFGGTELQGSCCAVIGCLLFIVLAASIIVSCVYQVMSYFKLKDIEREIKNQN